VLYNLIIVDDEKKIRELLCKVIDWESLGFRIAGTFSDGDEAIGHIKQNEVHCVLSDIKMSRVSGVEIAKYIQDNKLNIKIVLISAYQDFQYALDAIKFGVYNYLIKPAKISELTSTFSMLKEELDHIYLSNGDETDLQYKIEFLNNLISGIYTYSPDLEERLKETGIDINSGCKCAIWEFTIINYKDYIDKHWVYHKSSLANLFQNFLNDTNGILKGYFVNLNDNCVKCIIFDISIYDGSGGKDKFKETLDRYISAFLMNLSNYTAIKPVHKSLKIYENIEQLQNQDHLTFPEQISEIVGSDNLLKCQLKLFNSFVLSKNLSGVLELLTIFSNELNKLDLGGNRLFVNTLITSTLNILEDESYNFEDINEFTHTLNNADSVKDLYHAAASVYKNLISSLDIKDSSYQIVNTAKDYIKQNCRNDISLEDVARHIHLSPNYLSKLFRKYSGDTFLNFLIQTRMEKAKELLKQPGSKVYEVSEAVGYKNLQFFYRTFRNNVGCTPKEYQTKYFKGDR